MTKCPYVPPHPWAVDFPHLMLRAKATRARDDGFSLRERLLARPRRSAASPAFRWCGGGQRRQSLQRRPACCWRRRSASPAMHRCRNFTRAPRAASGIARHHGAPAGARSARTPHAHARGAARSGRAVHDLLWQPQRAGSRHRPGRGVRPQRHSGAAGAEGALLRHAAAGTRGSGRRWRGLQGGKHSAAAGGDRGRLRHRGADSQLRAHVQAGVAADVPGGSRMCRRRRRASTTRSST